MRRGSPSACCVPTSRKIGGYNQNICSIYFRCVAPGISGMAIFHNLRSDAPDLGWPKQTGHRQEQGTSKVPCSRLDTEAILPQLKERCTCSAMTAALPWLQFSQPEVGLRACKAPRFENHIRSSKSNIASQSFVLDFGAAKVNLNLYPSAAPQFILPGSAPGMTTRGHFIRPGGSLFIGRIFKMFHVKH